MHLSSVSQATEQHISAQSIYYLLFPRCPINENGIRTRAKDSVFKILNALYQLQKATLLEEKKAFGKAKITIAKTARVGKTSVTSLICSDYFSGFCQKFGQFKGVNSYQLRGWVIEMFKFFEMKGMMHGIIDNFSEWKKTFKKRMDKWLLPLLEKGHTLQEILVNKLSTINKLSTENDAKPADPTPLKPAGIKPFGGSRPFRDLNDTVKAEESFSPCKNSYESLAKEMQSFGLRLGDATQLFNCYGLYTLRGASNRMQSFIRSGNKADSPIKMFQFFLNAKFYKPKKGGRSF